MNAEERWRACQLAAMRCESDEVARRALDAMDTVNALKDELRHANAKANALLAELLERFPDVETCGLDELRAAMAVALGLDDRGES